MLSKLILLVQGTVTAFPLVGVVPADGEDINWESKLRNEATSSWNEYLRLQERMDIRYKYVYESFVNKGEGSEPTRRETLCHILGHGQSRVAEFNYESGRSIAVIQNDEGYFAVEKPNENSQYTLLYRGDDFSMIESLYTENAAFVRSPAQIGRLPLKELIRSPRCDIKSVVSEKNGSRELVRVEFNYDRDEVLQYVGGTLWLNPERLWLIERAELRFPAAGAKHLLEITYGENVGGLPSIKEITFEHIMPSHDKAEPASVWTFVSDRWERPEVPEERFTLAAYGIRGADEAPLRSKAPRAHRWWLAAGAALAVLAVGMRVARFRMGRAATQTQS